MCPQLATTSILISRTLRGLIFTALLTTSFSFSASAQSLNDQGKSLFREAQELAQQPEAAKKRLALEKFQEAARLFHEAGVPYNELGAKFGGAFLAEQLNDYKTARDLYQQSLPLFETPDQKAALSEVLYKVGRFSLLIGERVTAIDYFTQLSHVYEQLGQVDKQAATESDVGGIYYQLGKYDQAIQFLDQALNRRRPLGNQCDIAATLTNLGAVYPAKGQWTRALDILQKQALPLYNTSPECVIAQKYSTDTECSDYLAATLVNIGKVYYDLVDYRLARCFYERAIPLLTDKTHKAALINNLGTIEYALKKYDAALARFEEARTLQSDIASAEALTNIGVIQAKQQNVQALASLGEALRLRREIGSANGEATTLNSLGEVYNRLSRPKEALDSINRAIPLFRSAGDLSGEATALSNAMISLRMLGNRKAAISNGELSVSRFQKLRLEARRVNGQIERTYRNTVRQAYQNLAELLIEDGRYEQAIQVLSLYRDEQSFGSTQDGNIKQVAFSEVISAQKALTTTPSFRAIVLYTLIADGKLYVLAVMDEGIKVFSRTIESQTLNQRVNNLLKVLHCADLNPYPAAAQLYELVFKATLVTDRRTTLEAAVNKENPAALLWSLDQPLSAIPISALYNTAAKQFLIEKYQIAVFTRSDAESFKREPRPWFYGIGLGTSRQFTGGEPLPGAEASLAAIFGNEETKRPGVLKGKTIVNEKFTARTLEDLDGHWPLVHVVSHFILTEDDSELSFLRLGDGDRYTLARMREHPRLFAGVELLALPICESAVKGSDAYGKETEALADLAQRLGANSVLASLWKVSYHVTPRLMLRFYELTQAHQDWSKAELLRQTQLDLIHGEISIPLDRGIVHGTCRLNSTPRRGVAFHRKAPFAHPFYWSAFVLYGTGR
jgi:CHAT domain-containing protein/Tfp pilus assembly protein PilF